MAPYSLCTESVLTNKFSVMHPNRIFFPRSLTFSPLQPTGCAEFGSSRHVSIILILVLAQTEVVPHAFTVIFIMKSCFLRNRKMNFSPLGEIITYGEPNSDRILRVYAVLQMYSFLTILILSHLSLSLSLSLSTSLSLHLSLSTSLSTSLSLHLSIHLSLSAS